MTQNKPPPHLTGICKNCESALWDGAHAGLGGVGLRDCGKGGPDGQITKPKAGLVIVERCRKFERYAGAGAMPRPIGFADREPCSPGCDRHVTHPCEKCGRTMAKGAYTPGVRI